MGEGHPPEQRVLGERVKRARATAGLTLKALGERCGLSPRFLSEVEAGRANPSIGSLRELARALDADLLGLLHDGPTSAAHEALLALVQRLDAGAARAALEQLKDGADGRAGRPVALLGLRGAGKSSVGQRLAERLGRAFVELDQLIEREAGMQLGDLFELHGEEHVRALERRVLASVLGERGGAVLATGGGLVTHPESWAELNARALTVWLRATPQQHWDRVVAQGDLRPMANRSRARAELEALYEARAPLYQRADMVIDTRDVDVEGVCERLLAALAPPASPEAGA
jgi:XRE family transcriptional regulator, aerobic/anaerobic benzoate catabolism transcriptional regulator